MQRCSHQGDDSKSTFSLGHQAKILDLNILDKKVQFSSNDIVTSKV